MASWVSNYHSAGKLPYPSSQPELAMDTFIVRIYRYGDKDLQQLFGLVEIPGSDRAERFATLDELWAIISSGWNDVKEQHEATKN